RLAIEKGMQVSCGLAAITLDAAKAFDTVSHPVLFRKLLDTGTPPQFVRCISNVFRRHVNILPDKSAIRVTRSVPQGGLISPNGFKEYIDDLPCSVSEYVIRQIACAEIRGELKAAEKKFYKANGIGPLPRPVPLYADDAQILVWA